MTLASGTITFLFTDIEGSTPLWDKHPQEMHSALDIHNALLHKVIAANGGQVFKIVGDEFQVAFTKPHEAVKAALEAQVQLKNALWPEAIGEIRVRMGIHTGEAQSDGNDDYFSNHTLNRVARISSAGHGGQVLISRVSAELARERLEPAIKIVDLGEHYLKGLSQPEHIYQVVASGLPQEFPPLTTSVSAHNLPSQRSSFIGREKKISDVISIFDSSRLATLTGIGGVGKTRIAIETAYRILHTFSDGICWVELASITDPDRVVDAVAATLPIQEQADRQLIKTLENMLQNQNRLIILDNCEHLIEGTAKLVDHLLSSCKSLHFLVTSREPLHIEGEMLLHIPPLSIPKGDARPGSLAASEAGRLFIERTQAVMPEFKISDENSHDVYQICRRLDGIPLAIELAAARVPVLQISQIAARLDAIFQLLPSGRRTSMQRHQTLHSTIDWSYQLLSTQEKKLFERLSIFSGEWTLEAAEAVCADESIDNNLVLDLLTSLVNKSLVVLHRHLGREVRFRFLEPIRQYARSILDGSNTTDLYARRHMVFYLTFAEENAQKLSGEDQLSAIKNMELDIDNLRAALAWSIGSPDSLKERIRLVIALSRYWLVKGNLHEGRDWMSAVLEDNKDGDKSEERVTALDLAGMMAYQQSDYQASKIAWEENLHIARQLGEKGLPGMHRALVGLAMIASEVGDYQTSSQMFKEGLEITRKLQDELSEGNILRNLGWLAMRTGDYPEANIFLGQAERIFRKFNERVWLSSTISGLGEVATRQGDLETAKKFLEEALALRRELDSKWGIGATLGTLGWVAMSAGEYENAKQYFGESLSVRLELGDKGGIAWCLEKIAQTLQTQKYMERAALLFGAAAALRKSIDSVIDKADLPEYEVLIKDLEASLGEGVFNSLWQQGTAMNIDQSVALALKE